MGRFVPYSCFVTQLFPVDKTMILTCRMNIAEGVLGPYVPMNKQIKRMNLHVQSESDDLLVKRQNDNTCCCISFCCQSPQGTFF